MKKILAVIAAIAVAVGILIATANPASAANAYVYNSSISEGPIGVSYDGGGRWLYPGNRTGATTDYVSVPAGHIAYHYYRGQYVGLYGPGRIVSVGGLYQHVFYVYRR